MSGGQDWASEQINTTGDDMASGGPIVESEFHRRMSTYRCRHCGKTVKRESAKQWIKSYCTATGKNVRLWRVR